MIQPYAESPSCPHCKKPLVRRFKVLGSYAYFPPTRHQCERCKISVVSWIILATSETKGQLQVVLPLNYTDYGDTPEDLWKSNVFNSRELLVLTAQDLMSETEGSESITIEDIIGLYSSSLRAAHAN